MFGSVILDVAIGLVLIYLLLSLVSASVREGISSLLKTRSRTLDQGMHELLSDAQLVEDLYNHPLINCLYRGGDYATARAKRQLPSYIPSKSFSAALLDLIVRGRDVESALAAGPEGRVITTESVRAQVGRVGSARVQRAVLTALDAADGDLAEARANLEHWFDSTMDRVSGWYKRNTQIYVFCIGLLIVVVADADSFSIARRLYTDPAMRQEAVAIAGSRVATDTSAQVAASQLRRIDLPIMGWQHIGADSLQGRAKLEAYGRHSLNALIGWLVTALAISLGAPFWFDTLGRIMVVRNTVKPTQKSPVEASDDRQAPPAPVVASAPAQRTDVASAAPVVVVSGAPPAGDFVPQAWAGGHPQGGVL